MILRRVVSGKVQTQLVAGEIHAKRAIANAPNLYDIAAVLDLNGDGKLEVVVHSFYYEVAKAGFSAVSYRRRVRDTPRS